MQDNSTRRTFLKQSAATAATAVVGSGLASTAAAAKDYDYLDPVFTTSSLNIREGAGTNYGVKATADNRTGGRIYKGPESADGYNWWKVNFSGDSDNGRVTGWVAEDWLSASNFICPMTGTVTSNWDDCRPLGSCTRQHKAVDFANGGGTPITAAAGGTTEHRYDKGGYGNWLIIYHGNGWKTGYGHLSSFAVGDGVQVSQGETVAYEGDTGSGSGAHLDFQVWDPNWDKRQSYYDEGEAVTEGTGVPRVFF
jgi:murein DD-endopeptidase MepM/ murein hydrolase activator NlpD